MRTLLERLGGFLPAAIALTLPTAFLPGAEDSFILPRASIVVGGACLGIGLALLTPRGPGLGRLRWPLAAAAAAAILAFAFSVSWPLSLAGAYTRYESLPTRLGYLGLFASAAWLLRTSQSRDWVIGAFVFGSAVACLEALAQWAEHLPYRPDGNLGNANLLAALISMALPLAIARGLRRGRFMAAWWAAAVVLAPALLVSTSRSGALGAVAGCLAIGVFALRGRLAAVATVASLAVVSGIVLLITVSPLNALNDDPASLRIHLWQDGLRMVAARPLTGWGQDTTGLAFGQFLSRDYASFVMFDRIHSGPLDITATQGVIGLAMLAWVLVLLFRGAWHTRFANNLAPLMAACIGYSVWVFFNFDWAPATGAFWLLAGTAWSGVRAAETAPPQSAAGGAPASRPVTLVRSGLAVVMALAAVWLAAMPLLADVWYLHGRPDLSVAVDPLQARYHWALGLDLVARGSISRGVDELRRAADLGETEPGLYVELGDREQQLGRSAQARTDYKRALEIGPYYAPASERLAAMSPS